MGTITLIYPDDKQQLLSDNVDLVFPGRLTQDPVPTKIEWVQIRLEYILKQRFSQVIRENTVIEEIEFGSE